MMEFLLSRRVEHKRGPTAGKLQEKKSSEDHAPGFFLRKFVLSMNEAGARSSHLRTHPRRQDLRKH